MQVLIIISQSRYGMYKCKREKWKQKLSFYGNCPKFLIYFFFNSRTEEQHEDLSFIKQEERRTSNEGQRSLEKPDELDIENGQISSA